MASLDEGKWPIEFELAMVLTACITLYIFAYGSFSNKGFSISKASIRLSYGSHITFDYFYVIKNVSQAQQVRL